MWLNCSLTSWPNVYPAPRGDTPQPAMDGGVWARRYSCAATGRYCTGHPPAAAGNYSVELAGNYSVELEGNYYSVELTRPVVRV